MAESIALEPLRAEVIRLEGGLDRVDRLLDRDWQGGELAEVAGEYLDRLGAVLDTLEALSQPEGGLPLNDRDRGLYAEILERLSRLQRLHVDIEARLSGEYATVAESLPRVRQGGRTVAAYARSQGAANGMLDQRG
jgi:hypothetical protein